MIGVDEVGRGCWAGPLLVVAARARAELPKGLKDSKLLSRQQREKMLNKLSSTCEFGEGWVKAAEINSLGLAEALRLGTSRALKNLSTEIDEKIILDGKVNYVPKQFKNSSAMVDADNLVPIVSAAGVYAKVTRDNFMARMGEKYPRYSFDKHVGYGTAAHRQAIERYGVLVDIHRLNFKPVKALSGGEA